MIKTAIFLAGLIAHLLLTIPPAYSDQGVMAQEEIPSVHIPEGSTLKIDSHRCPSNVFGFSGHIELDGKLDVY